ncbi:hypothetical protein AAVH_40952 [Aphelenchoides avenae]|nr:hypothetical protein AAVH_40952 [Aphelenchus avenae]
MILPRTSPQCQVTDLSEDALLDFVYGESDEGQTSPLLRTLDVQSPKITSHFIQRLAKFHRDASGAPQPVSLNVQFPIENQDIETAFAVPAQKTEHKSGYTLHFDGGLRVAWSSNQRCLRISRGVGNDKKEASP